MTKRLMRQRSMALLAFAILLLLLAPAALSLEGGGNLSSKGMTAALSSSPAYTESISVYLTSAETFWQAAFSGGNITLASLTIPSSVTSFSITLTHYARWNSQFELFTKNGFGLLGPSEPLPDGAILTVNTTSSSDATGLASSLDQMFALVFAPYKSSSSSFSFISPLRFQTEMHTFFWKLVPSSYHGFASQFTEQQLESSDLAFYKVSYSSGGYTISIGGLKPLVSTSFFLYTQLGITSPKFNYSSLAASSSISVHVLGGLILLSKFAFVNHYNNFSASMFEGSSGGGNVGVPNLNATLDFSFPTIEAFRQIVTLNPVTNQTVGVSITVKNISPVGAPAADNVKVNDTWIYSHAGALNITAGKTYGEQNLSAGQSMTVPYAFTVLRAAIGSYIIPPIPVTYQFSAANQTLKEQAYLNTETLTINGTGPAIEAIESITSGTISSGQALSFNITATNKGSAAAFNLMSAGRTRPNLPQGQSWSFIASSQSGLTQANSTISYSVTWQPSSSQVQTNTIGSIYSFANPGSPASSISKAVSFFKSSNTVNVTLLVLDNSGIALSNLTVADSLPAGMTFQKSYEPNSLRLLNGLVLANVSSLSSNQNVTFTYSLSVTNLNENYAFMPANVSSVWNNVTIVHFSQGAGLALGVSATKAISPTAGFQGSSASVSLAVTNQGVLPIYEVELNPTADTFLSLSSQGSTLKPVLPSGSSFNSTISGNFTGAPGSYNSSTGAATYIFAGFNQTAQSNIFSVTIYKPLQGSLSVISSKIEEDHSIVIRERVTNPSNVNVSNVEFTMILPNNLKLVSGQQSFQIPSLGAGGTYENNITLTTNLPQQYTLNGTLRFQYNGKTINGQISPLGLTITDDLSLRYGIPVLVGLVIVLLTLFYVRRLTRQQKV